MEPGTKVRMSVALKQRLCWLNPQHVQEFGDCVGTVLGPTDYGTSQGPEIDVRWHPSDCRFAYTAADLEEQDAVEDEEQS